MRKTIIATLFVAFFATLFVGCGGTHGVVYETGYGAGVPTSSVGKEAIIATTWYGDRRKFDSVCISQGIPTDLARWRRTAFTDEETGRRIDEYMLSRNKGRQVYRTVLEVPAGKDTVFALTLRKMTRL